MKHAKGVPGFETFEHGADIGVRGRGKTIEEAFENGARSMSSLVVEDLDAVRSGEEVEVRCSSYDMIGLFVAWLNALVARSDVEGLVWGDFSVLSMAVSRGELFLEALARGEPFDPERHERGVEVKGATFTEAAVNREGDLWVAQCVVDV